MKKPSPVFCLYTPQLDLYAIEDFPHRTGVLGGFFQIVVEVLAVIVIEAVENAVDCSIGPGGIIGKHVDDQQNLCVRVRQSLLLLVAD